MEEINRAYKYVDVILPLAIEASFTYEIPEDINNIDIGFRVSVPVGQRKIYTGIVGFLHNKKPEGFEIKKLYSVLDREPIVNNYQLKFWQWMANYYICSIGEVYKAALPSGLKLESQTMVYALEEEFPADKLPINEKEAFYHIRNAQGISIKELKGKMGVKDVYSLVKRLMSKNAVSTEDKFNDKYKPLKKDFIKIAYNWDNEDKILELMEVLEVKAPRQYNFLVELQGYFDENNTNEASKAEIMNVSKTGYSSLQSLIKKGVLVVVQKDISRLDNDHGANELSNAHLADFQHKAFNELLEEFKLQNVVLLHGVTSSGKTEIYIELIRKTLKEGRQVLYLLPEIALTAQIIKRLKAVFGSKVGIYHSKYSDSERVEVYLNILGSSHTKGKRFNLVLGVRSSVFLPFDNLGLIIVDEEHENTYKQFDPAPRYNARDAAVVLASLHNAKVLMGTATPSFETYLNTKIKKYGLVTIEKRYKEMLMPEIEVVDLKQQRKKKMMREHFSRVLLKSVEEVLSHGKQVILFQNRRGFSPYVECFDCGAVPECKYCDVTLTYHKKKNKLTCHYCGYSISYSSRCESCKSDNMHTCGFGTEKIEDEILKLLPKSRVARLDLDSARTRKTYEKIIERFEDGNIDILVGTQMVSKGLDFKNVKLVGILNADNLLFFPDFRAYERAYQLIAQVSGRAGRHGDRGKVIIQTSNPESDVFAHIISNNYQHWFGQQMKERKLFNYPPYFRLIRFTFKHRNINVVNRASFYFANILRRQLPDKVKGPESPLINKLFNYHQKCVLVKLEKDGSYGQIRSWVLGAVSKTISEGEHKGIQIAADVDPYN